MKADEAREHFESQLSAAGLALAGLSIDEGFRRMFDFYRGVRADDAPKSDMLLYQWSGGGEEPFTLDLTRQFIVEHDEEEDDDEAIRQLSLRYYFAPTAAPPELESGDKWCPTFRPQAVDYFDKFVRESAAYRAAVAAQVERVTLDYEIAG